MWCVKIFTFGLILQGCVMISDFQSTNEDYPDVNDKYIPNFVTIGQKYSIAIGSTVVLPCKLNQSEFHREFVLAWKKDDAVLAAGPMKVSFNPRIKLLPSPSERRKGSPFDKDNSYNLEVRDVRISDTGKYICQLSTMPPREVIHTLVVLVPPKIIFMTPAARVETSKGSLIHLECHGSGNPEPVVSWSRKNNVMPNGEPSIVQDIVDIPFADKNAIGIYRCTADNRVGQPDWREAEVNVIYSPEIEVERPVIHTGVGYEVQLVCVIHAEPAPIIHWFQGTQQLATTERHSQQNHGSRYTLNIRNVTFYDLDNYTCQATNKLGKERKSMVLTGAPAMCVFESPTLGNSRDQYNISWTTVSYSQIQEYRLFFRLQYTTRSSEDESNENHLQKPNQYQYSGRMPSYYSKQKNHVDHWENVVLAEKGYDRNGPSGRHASHYHVMQHSSNGEFNPRHHMSHMLRNLTPASNYEARVQARNMHGWNDLSPIFHFSTRAEDVEVELSAQPAISKNADVDDATRSRGYKLSSFYTFIITFFYFVSILIENLL